MNGELELLADPGTTLADVARAVALGDVLEKVVKARREELRDGPLADLAAQAAEVTGSDGFTSRINGVGQVIQTAPTPTVKVQDSQTFGAWLAEQGGVDLGLVEGREVARPSQSLTVCLQMLRKYVGEGDEEMVLALAADLVREVDPLTVEWSLSETAVDTLLDKGWIVVHEGRVHELDAGAVGDPVPGLTVSQAKQSTYVKVDKDARKQVTRQVRGALGLEGGAA